MPASSTYTDRSTPRPSTDEVVSGQRFPVLDLDRAMLSELMLSCSSNTVHHLPRALPDSYCRAAVAATSRLNFSAYEKTAGSEDYAPIIKHGPTVFDYAGGRDFDEYFAAAHIDTELGSRSFAAVGVANPQSIALRALRHAWDGDVQIAAEPDPNSGHLRPYFSGVIRDIAGGALPHVDDAPTETPELAIGSVIAQASLLFYLQVPTEGGGLRVYDKTATENDWARMRGYGFEPATVAGRSFNGVTPAVGSCVPLPDHADPLRRRRDRLGSASDLVDLHGPDRVRRPSPLELRTRSKLRMRRPLIVGVASGGRRRTASLIRPIKRSRNPKATMTEPFTFGAITLPGTSADSLDAPPPVRAALREVPHHAFNVDPAAADTAEFLDRYRWPAHAAANTIVVRAKQGDVLTYAVCVAPATTRLDLNRVVKGELNARKVSFAPMDYAVCATGMECGSITPFGIPPEWAILVDPRVSEEGLLVVGGGRRQLKIVVDGRSVAAIPHARLVDGLAVERGDAPTPTE